MEDGSKRDKEDCLYAVHTFTNLRYDSPSWRLSPASREAASRQMHARVAVKLASWTATEVIEGAREVQGIQIGRGPSLHLMHSIAP